MALQVLVTAQAGQTGKETVVEVSKLNTGLNINEAKLPTSNRDTSKILGFLTACKLYVRIKIKNATVKEQIQWV